MNKSLAAIASATVALAAFASSSAEAGFYGHHHGGGFLGHVLSHSFRHCHRPEYVVRVPVEQVYITRPREVVVAEQEAPEQQVVVVHNENSAIAVASADVADIEPTDSVEKIIVKKDKTAVAASKPAKVAEAAVDVAKPQPSKRIDCKKFFPSVGMTLTVPCE